MKELFTLINDDDSRRNWAILAVKGEIIWLHLSAPAHITHEEDGYDVSKIFEVNIHSKKWRLINLSNNLFILRGFYVTDDSIYATIIEDVNKDGKVNEKDFSGGIKLVRQSKKNNETTVLYTFDEIDYILDIEQVIDDNFILISLLGRDKHGNSIEKYDLLDISNHYRETIYIVDDNDLTEAKLYLTKDMEGHIYLIKDLHVIPSDKPVSNGKPDKIIIFEVK